MANRNATKVCRAAARNPKPSANSSTVMIIRAVRASARGKSLLHSTPSQIPRSTATSLVPHDLSIIVRDLNSHKLKLIFFIHPKGPGEVFPLQIQSQQFALLSADRDLLSSRQFHAYPHRSPVLRYQHAELHRTLLAL